MGCSNSVVEAQARRDAAAQDFHARYILGVKLGQGGFGQVRAVTQVSDGPSFACEGDDESKDGNAVKILHMGEKNSDRKTRAHLQSLACREISVWKSIGVHPNCVRLHQTYRDGNFCFIVMEKCSCSLFPALDAMRDITEEGLAKICQQMMLGIAHCHSVNVVHSDIKPGNFLVGGQDCETLKLCDFGLSAVLPKTAKLPGVVGTVPFMCPEMLANKGYDEKADVWSFAALVYLLMFGRYPYMPEKYNPQTVKLDTKAAIRDGTPAPSYKVPLATEGAFRSDMAIEFVKRLLIRDPEKRPSAKAVLCMPWIASDARSHPLCAVLYTPGRELPSLRPTLQLAKKLHAPSAMDPLPDLPVDALLNALQMERHGAPLPPTPPPLLPVMLKNLADASLSPENSCHAEKLADDMRKISMHDWRCDSESECERTTRASTTDSFVYM